MIKISSQKNCNDYANYLKRQFNNCDDFNLRKIILQSGQTVYLANLGNYSDRNFISETIIKPIMHTKSAITCADDFFAHVSSSEFSQINQDEVTNKILMGCAIVFTTIDSNNVFFCATAKRGNSRSVSEPDSEVVVRGPREGFIENSEDNVALIRKRLRTCNLKAQNIKLGTITHTNVTIMYIEGVADSNTIQKVKEVLSKINLPGIMDSGYIEHYLQNSTLSLFTNVGNSEKPDKVCAKLLEGRIAIICDGSPVVLTVPYLLIEGLQSSEDYLKTPIYASFLRIIRIIASLIAIYLPSIYLAVLEHHTGNLPYKLYKTVITSRENVPFSVFAELFVILIIFEIIREVSLRMPRAVGDAVGIVAGLILGDAAISAGITSPPVIMVASLTAVSSFIVPPFMNSIVLIRFLNLLLSKFFGFAGIMLSIVFFTAELCKKESFGVPYLTPFSPLSKRGFADGIFLFPKKALSNTTSELKSRRSKH